MIRRFQTAQIRNRKFSCHITILTDENSTLDYFANIFSSSKDLSLETHNQVTIQTGSASLTIVKHKKMSRLRRILGLPNFTCLYRVSETGPAILSLSTLGHFCYSKHPRVDNPFLPCIHNKSYASKSEKIKACAKRESPMCHSELKEIVIGTPEAHTMCSAIIDSICGTSTFVRHSHLYGIFQVHCYFL